MKEGYRIQHNGDDNFTISSTDGSFSRKKVNKEGLIEFLKTKNK